MTHLHFDHCGGTTAFAEPWNPESPLIHVFPNAEYHVNARHWITATEPNAREKASFLPENIEPLKDALAMGRLHLLEDGHVFEPGFDVMNMDGHTVGQQLPRLKGNIESSHSSVGTQATKSLQTIVFAGDLIPLHQHLKLPWIMGYDMAPLQTLTEKEEFLRQAKEEDWILFLEHDAQKVMMKVEE
jgi:glyoxylase-like metal-dependent hydrolase (beta-lactamase superfamily II)